MRLLAALSGCLAALVPGQAMPSGAPPENASFRGDLCPAPNLSPLESATDIGVASLSPPGRQAAAAVAGFLAGLRRGDERQLRRWSVDAAVGTAPACLAGLRSLAAACTPEAPYLLDDNRIRVGWVCNGLMSYDSFFLIADGKVADIRGMDATQPIVALPAPFADSGPRKE